MESGSNDRAEILGSEENNNVKVETKHPPL